jgi:hypothetical protein
MLRATFRFRGPAAAPRSRSERQGLIRSVGAPNRGCSLPDDKAPGACLRERRQRRVRGVHVNDTIGLSMDSQQIEAWISSPRFAPFLRAAAGNRALAVALYEWHAEVGAACFATMHHLEILVRNAIDAELGNGQNETPLTQTWLLDFDVLRPDGVKQVIFAVERLEKGKTMTRSRVIAGLSFGFWSGLFGPRYEELWRQRLRHAFPHAKERKDLSSPMEALRRFRNRLAHHDSILHEAVDERFAEMLRLAAYIDPAASTWLQTSSRVDDLILARPT